MGKAGPREEEVDHAPGLLLGVYRTHFFGFGTESLKPNIENRYSVPNLLKPNIVTRYSAEPEPNSSLKMM